MQPQQPNQSPYEFFMEPQAPQKQSMLGGRRPNNAALIGLSVGIVLVIGLIILAIVGAGGNKEPAVTAVAQDQAEISHLAAIATQNSNTSQQQTQNFAQTCALSAASAETQLVKTLAASGTKLGSSTLGLKRNAAIDNELNQAVNSSTFDTTFLSVMQTQLSTYTADLKSAYSTTKSDAVRQVLSSDYQDSRLLVQQFNATQMQVQNANS